MISIWKEFIETDKVNLGGYIDEYLIPNETEKKKNAEFSTPYKLRQEMLDKIPVEFWKSPKKVFEPCCGKGGFIVDIIERFMNGLIIPDKKERYRIIVEECIYFSDINENNIDIVKSLLKNTFKLNYHIGDTLKLDINEKWGLEGFDAVIGNPPYSVSVGTGHTIWQFFTYKSLKEWINPDGYLLFIHPARWRKPESIQVQKENLKKLMCNENTMIYLEIHNTKDGMKTFRCGTRYDWYLIKKELPVLNFKTLIKDEENIEKEISLQDLEFIPNSDIEYILNTIYGNNNRVLKRCYNHSSTKKNTSFIKDEKFKYPVIHATPKNSTRFLYTDNNNEGYFGIKKLIFGNSGINKVILDNSGKYGVSEHAISLIYYNDENPENIRDALETKKFKKFLKSCSWSGYQIQLKLFRYLKKDFWKEFVEDD